MANGLNQLSIKTSQQSGLPYFVIDHTQQIGADFGAKLQNAFKLVLAKGYDHVVAIGNDCPDLSVEDLLTAKQAVETGHIALGPAKDGGTYLIGISGEDMDNGYLTGIDWNTARVYHQLTVTASKPVIALETKSDIDFGISHNLLIKGGKWLEMVWRWILLYLRKPQPHEPVFTPQPIILAGTLHRGPPLISW